VNAAVNDVGIKARETENCLCFHCGQTIVDQAVCESIHGKLQSFCCTGCSAATLWIDDAGLSDYRSEKGCVGEECRAGGGRVHL